MEKYEYFGGVPEVGIVPRAPACGPAPPPRLRAGARPRRIRRQGEPHLPSLPAHQLDRRGGARAGRRGVGAALGVADARGGRHPSCARDGRSRPRRRRRVPRHGAPRRQRHRGHERDGAAGADGLLLRAPLRHVRYFVHQGGGTLETTFGPIEYRKGDFLIVPKGITHRFEPSRPGPSTTGCTRASRAIPRRARRPPPGASSRTARATTASRARSTRATRRGASRSSPRWAACTRGACTPTHPFDAVGWRGDYLPYSFAVEDVRPLTADRSHVPPSGHTVFKLPGCYLCVFTVRRAERDGMWVPFFHKNLDYLETLGYHYGDFFSAGGVVQQGMVTVHPVGPAARTEAGRRSSRSSTASGRSGFDEVGIMADFANPAKISDFALGLSRAGYMAAGAATRAARGSGWSPTRLDEVRGLGERAGRRARRAAPAERGRERRDLMRFGPLLGGGPLPDGARPRTTAELLRRAARAGGGRRGAGASTRSGSPSITSTSTAASRARPCCSAAAAQRTRRIRLGSGRGRAALRPSAARGRGLRDGRRALGRPARTWAWARATSRTSTRASASIRRRRSARASTRRSRSSCARGRASAYSYAGAYHRVRRACA